MAIQSLLNVELLWQRSKCVISYSCIFYFEHACPKLNFVLISRSTSKCATQNFKNLRNSNLCSHLMAILGSQNKNTDFLLILA